MSVGARTHGAAASEEKNRKGRKGRKGAWSSEYEGEAISEESPVRPRGRQRGYPQYDREAVSDQSQTPARKGGGATYHATPMRNPDVASAPRPTTFPDDDW